MSILCSGIYLFTELVFKEKALTSYEAQDGFKALLGRKNNVDSKKAQAPFGENSQNGATGSA